MSLFTIDENKCKKDGICVAECPMQLIGMEDENSIPAPTPDAAERCVECGHCVAVCPHGAFTLNRLDGLDFPAIKKEWVLSPEQAEQFLRSRRSIRNYKKQSVDQELLTRLIEIARYSPTGTNSQQVRWLVVNSRDQVVKIVVKVIELLQQMLADEHPLSKKFNLAGMITAWEKGDDLITRGAPALVMTHAPKEYGLAYIDCTSVLAYFDLAAPTLGLGTCWAGIILVALNQYPPLRDTLPIPEDHTVQGTMMIGYPKFKYQRLVPRNAPDITWL